MRFRRPRRNEIVRRRGPHVRSGRMRWGVIPAKQIDRPQIRRNLAANYEEQIRDERRMGTGHRR